MELDTFICKHDYQKCFFKYIIMIHGARGACVGVWACHMFLVAMKQTTFWRAAWEMFTSQCKRCQRLLNGFSSASFIFILELFRLAVTNRNHLRHQSGPVWLQRAVNLTSGVFFPGLWLAESTCISPLNRKHSGQGSWPLGEPGPSTPLHKSGFHLLVPLPLAGFLISLATWGM